jgi:hypothetical protein
MGKGTKMLKIGETGTWQELPVGYFIVQGDSVEGTMWIRKKVAKDKTLAVITKNFEGYPGWFADNQWTTSLCCVTRISAKDAKRRVLRKCWRNK